jgi:uncharacterized membrane protein YtjA (UPF0391 family)
MLANARPAFRRQGRSVSPHSVSPEQLWRIPKTPLLRWALVFLVVSLVAGLLGFTGVSVVSAEIARTLFFIFLMIFVVLLTLGLTIFWAGPSRSQWPDS